MKTTLKMTAIVIAVLLSAIVYAQEWTKEQTEVWKVVEDSWASWKDGNIEVMASFFHEKYQGWSDDAPLPMSKKKIIDWYTTMKDNTKAEYISLNPARITVVGNVAVVDYYFSLSITIMTGEEKTQESLKGKNAEFYIKEGGKWQLLGDMTVFEEEDDD